MPKLDTKYIVGYQSTFYKGRRPHFFVYEVLRRQVVRRFLSHDPKFTLEWQQRLTGSAGINPFEKKSERTGGADGDKENQQPNVY